MFIDLGTDGNDHPDNREGNMSVWIRSEIQTELKRHPIKNPTK